MKEFQTLALIKYWIQNQKAQILEDLGNLVSIPSISQSDSPVLPYGKSCREALDFMLNTAHHYQLDTSNYFYHAGSIHLNHPAFPKHSIGIWSHLDVVPAGDGWSFPPFQMTRKNGFLIGRGVQDNKCAAIGVLHAFRCLSELFPPLNNEYVLYMGCSEETTMNDVRFFTEHYPQPDLSLVADCGFPVCFGEKGILDVCFKSLEMLPKEVLALEAGTVSNTIPDTAYICLKRTPQIEKCLDALYSNSDLFLEEELSSIKVTAKGVSAHIMQPDQGKNAIFSLISSLCQAGIFSSDLPWIRLLLRLTADGHGKNANLFCQDTLSGSLTGQAGVVHLNGSELQIWANYRYPILKENGQLNDGKELICHMSELAQKHKFSLSIAKNSAPSYYDPDSCVVTTLTNTFNEVTGLSTKAYTMSGGTYARNLSHAMAFGMSMPNKQLYKEYPTDPRGDYHQANESLLEEDFFTAIAIYAQCILALDQLDL